MRKRTLFFFLCSTHLFFPALLRAQMDCSAHPDDMMMHDEHCAVFALVPEDGASHVSVSNGSWFAPATWNTGTVPGADATVLIDSGTVVTYDGSSNTEIFTIRVNGTLQFATGINTLLVVNTLVVDPAGIFTIGTAASPVNAAVTAQIIFPDQGAINTMWDPYQFSKGLVSHGSTTMYGAAKKSTISLTGSLAQGVNTLHLTESPLGWQPGDRLILPGVHTNGGGSMEDNSRYEDEVLIISSISGTNVQFEREADGSHSLLYSHDPPPGFGLQPVVGNLTRNIRIEAENAGALPVQQRGHLMLMHNPAQHMNYVYMYGLGRSDKSLLVDDPVVDSMGMLISGGSNPRGRYACHVHQAGRHDHAGEPLTITGCVVEGTPGWGFVHHSSHADLTDNIVFGFKGAGFVAEAGDELGSMVHNLSVKGYGLQDGDYTDLLDRLNAFDLGLEGDGFWMMGSNLSLIDNIATSCSGAGFNYFSDDDDITPNRRLKIPKAALPNPSITGALDSIYAGVTPVRANVGSQAYNVNQGMNFWTHLYNNDNVGDFSRMEYDGLTHNATSTVQNFHIWNIRDKGIAINYSSQLRFLDGILLGDMEHLYTNPDGSLVSENAGSAFVSNGVTGEVQISGCTIAGWQKALIALRTDNLVNGDDLEYNYKTSLISGNTLFNNVVSLVPETGQDAYYVPGVERFPAYLQLTEDNVFETIASDLPPLADFSYTSAGGLAISFDAGMSADPDPKVSNAGNGIAAYRWQFGDGETGYGKDPLHTFSSAGTYTVTLTVTDCLGQTTDKTKNISVNTEYYSNQIRFSNMEMDSLHDWKLVTSLDRFTSGSWGTGKDWTLMDGKAVIHKSLNDRYLVQVNRNDHLLQGVVPFSIQLRNIGDGASSNSLRVEITGVNGELSDDDPVHPDHISAWNNGDPEFSSTVLLSEEWGLTSYNWQTFSQDIDFGSGYQFLVIKIFSQGLKVSDSDEQGVDNMCLPCYCATPGGLLADDLTDHSATLIWDNVGALNYEVRYRPKGGSWISTEVNNTFMQLTSLLPNKRYQWQVRAECEGSWTAWSAISNFMTPATGSLCTSPTDLSVSWTTANAALVTWESIPGSLLYRVAWRATSGGPWLTQYISDTSVQLSSLLPSTLYNWRVSAQCTEGWKPFLSLSSFQTLAEREAGQMTENWQVYPNPAGDVVHMDLPGGTGQISLYDLSGQKLLQLDVPEGSTSLSVPVDHLNRGLYILHWIHTGGQETRQILLQ